MNSKFTNVFFTVFLSSFLFSCATTESTRNLSENNNQHNETITEDSDFPGLESEEQKHPSAKENAYSFIMYDNCPEETSALEARVSLKATIPDYTGTFIYTFKKPHEKNSQALSTYISACSLIKTYIEKGSSIPCSVKFFLTADGQGEELNFSTTKDALNTIRTLIKTDELTQEYKVYAFYIQS